MRKDTTTGKPSGLEEALARVGDRWALLIAQELLAGPRRFNQLLREVPGIAPNILSERLRRMERMGIVVAHRYSDRPPRFAYGLTAPGTELAGALRLLAQWGAAMSGRAEGLSHTACGTAMEARWYCPTCATVVEEEETSELRYL